MSKKQTRRTFTKEFKLDVIDQSEHCNTILSWQHERRIDHYYVLEGRRRWKNCYQPKNKKLRDHP